MSAEGRKQDLSAWLVRLAAWGGLILGVAWIVRRLTANTGCILDDEWTHYLFSRSVWQNPEVILDGWTRPGRNLIHIWAAPFGLLASRLFTFSLALLALLLSWRVGRILELRALWALPILFLFQAWMPELSYPVLTQTPFMLVWILGVWLGMKGRWHLAGVAFGYLSLVRHEGILLTGLWGLWVTCQKGGLLRGIYTQIRGGDPGSTLRASLLRDVGYALSTVSAIIGYNLVSYVWKRELPFALYFESKPTEIYGSGPIWHYVPLLIAGLGLFSLLLSVLGLFGLRGRASSWSLLLLTYPAYFIAHSLIYWQGAFASGGYYHFLMPMTPFFALLGVRGIELIGGFRAEKAWRRVATVCALLLVVFQGVRMDQRQGSAINWDRLEAEDRSPGFKLISDRLHLGLIAGPLRAGARQVAVMAASDWAAKTYPGAEVYASHVAHPFRRDLLKTRERQGRINAGIDAWPVGTVFIWDGHYSEHHGKQPWEEFAGRPEWQLEVVWEREVIPDEATELKDRLLVAVFVKKGSTSQTQ